MTIIEQELVTWNAQAKWLLENFAEMLSGRERDFVEDMAEQESVPSEKQQTWLERIFKYWARVYQRKMNS